MTVKWERIQCPCGVVFEALVSQHRKYHCACCNGLYQKKRLARVVLETYEVESYVGNRICMGAKF